MSRCFRPVAAAWAVGLLCGLLFYALLEWPGAPAQEADPRQTGLTWAWLAFGFGAQALFMSRMLVQWIATERARASVVPTSFWVISLLGGLSLLVYFLRRGDPVGVVGQATGVLIYARNLVFIRRQAHAATRAAGPGSEGSGPGEAA